MSVLKNIFSGPLVQPTPGIDLDELLQSTHKYGKCRVSRHDTGWYCCIEMNTNTTGTSFEVKSRFDHPTPIEAVTICIERMHAALRMLSA